MHTFGKPRLGPQFSPKPLDKLGKPSPSLLDWVFTSDKCKNCNTWPSNSFLVMLLKDLVINAWRMALSQKQKWRKTGCHLHHGGFHCLWWHFVLATMSTPDYSPSMKWMNNLGGAESMKRSSHKFPGLGPSLNRIISPILIGFFKSRWTNVGKAWKLRSYVYYLEVYKVLYAEIVCETSNHFEINPRRIM